jgi:hypothetical protein
MADRIKGIKEDDELDEELEWDEVQEQLEFFAPSIGKLIISYNSLEETVNSLLVEHISHDPGMGYLVISEMSFYKKVELLRNVYRRIASMCRLPISSPKIEPLFTRIFDANTTRNGIVHAAWEELNKKSEVRVKTFVSCDGPNINIEN